MRRLLALALAGAAVFSIPAAASSPTQYSRPCEGKIDGACHDQFCGIADCTIRDCHFYFNPSEGYNSAYCYGKERPRDPDWK